MKQRSIAQDFLAILGAILLVGIPLVYAYWVIG